MIAAPPISQGLLPHLNAWPGYFTPQDCMPIIEGSSGNRLHSTGRPGGKGEQQPGDPHARKGGETSGSDFHISVFPQEAIHFLNSGPGKLIVDGTVGGGGHTRRILASGALTLGLDQDEDALTYARDKIEPSASEQIALIRTNFRHLRELLDECRIDGVDGILVDLGVSSYQIDNPDRGFSFRGDGPLDMRMDTSAACTAADLVNTLPESELADIIYRYGEERSSRRIARAIVERRAAMPFQTTMDLATCIEQVKPRRGKKTHPATLTFQALRIAVNDELGALEKLLEDSVACLRPGGRLVVITFHSLEDRIVKRFIRSRSTAEIDRPEWPAPRPNPEHSFNTVLRKALSPSGEEITTNPRARSAKLRVAERLAS
ncbi:16S rRNA (cytosine(1402)-N(4))-methyltransferase RsmH [Verrucomicrobiales bacterium]|nr:16S rRNA (cytosine(1402)-N(4))-methyltransferase RsmH [Verrucomicrobiales bacterium]